ncbi:MAG TPA: thiamine phosphate synthase [Fimbriiglobus sp.]|nr:thiamine phosphate synthase [Fimbriiglobus sp.]
MAHELSPAVERAAEAAVESARRHGAEAVRLTDWLLGLIADDEGKPATLLARTGADVEAVRAALSARTDWTHPPAPPAQSLFTTGREKAIALRADPTLTTEFVLLAVLEADPRFRDQLAAVGVRVAALEALLLAGHHAAPADTDPGPTFTVNEPTEQHDAGRVVDANLNRAREALRVLEDYCRFVLNDRVLTEQVKEMRHELAAVAASLPSGVLLAARDTPGDVGTSVTTPGEYDRASPARVAAVNLKRLQEALRSIEEYGKVFGEGLGRRAEAVRYRTYTLERAVVRGADARARLADARLYVLLTGSQCAAALNWTIAEAAAGGAQVFQLREKTLSDRELLERARSVRRWTREAGTLFVVNDRPDIARLSEADGVHLGQDDLPVSAARRVVGPDALIGVSTHTPEQVRRAVLDGADYLGVGPTFPSQTKSFDHLPGLDFVRFTSAETSLPTFALGGISPANVSQVVEAGAKRIAVSAAIACADDPAMVARQLRLVLANPER